MGSSDPSTSKERKHHHKHSHSHSHKGRSKHKHHKHHKHRHKKSNKKHRKHSKIKIELDENTLQNALQSLEDNALEEVRKQVTEAETVELLLAAGETGRDDDSDDLDTSSDSENDQDSQTPENKSQDMIAVVSSTTVSELPKPSNVYLEPTNTESDSQSQSGMESGPESSQRRDASGEGSSLGDSKPLLLKAALSSKSKIIRINIQTKDLLGAEIKDSESKPDSQSQSPLHGGHTKTVTSGDSKVTYINLKANPLETSNNPRGETRNRSDSESESDIPSSQKDREKDKKRKRSSSQPRHYKSRSTSHYQHRSSRYGRSKSRSRSRSRSPRRYKHSKSRSRSRSPRRYKHSKSRSRSRSHSPRRYKSRSRSRSHSPRRYKHSKSRSRSRSHSPRRYKHSKSRSRSRSHSPRRYKSRSRSRSRSPHRSSRYRRSKSRSRSRSHHRSSQYRRSRSHQRSGRDRGSSRSRRNYRSRSRDRGSRRWRSRSPRRYYSPRRRRRHYNSRSRSPRKRGRSSSRWSRSRSRSRSRSSGREGGHSKETDKEQKIATITGIGGAQAQSDQKHTRIAQLTAFCKELQTKQEIEEKFGPEEGEAEPEQEIRAPFQVNPSPVYQSGLVFHNNAWKTPNQIVAESNALSEVKPLEEKFPVSAGIMHQKQEAIPGAKSTSKAPVSVGDLVVKRLEATQRLQENAGDVEAKQMLAYIEQQVALHSEEASAWAESQLRPGQFTGQKSLTALSREDHKIGHQAWAKKDMFRGLAPVMSGFGLKMLKKMGWWEGRPLGKKGEGNVEPIAVDVKLNRSGLSTVLDKQAGGVVPAVALQAANSKSAHLLQGKHPVSALQEICAKKRWNSPNYDLVDSVGPAHKKTFLYRVTVPLGTFQPATGSANKKQAKAEAATACLEALGFH